MISKTVEAKKCTKTKISRMPTVKLGVGTGP